MRSRDRLERVGLADDALARSRSSSSSTVLISSLDHLADRDAGPARDHLGDRLASTTACTSGVSPCSSRELASECVSQLGAQLLGALRRRSRPPRFCAPFAIRASPAPRARRAARGSSATSCFSCSQRSVERGPLGLDLASCAPRSSRSARRCRAAGALALEDARCSRRARRCRRSQSSSAGGVAVWAIATRAHAVSSRLDRLVGQLAAGDVAVREPHRCARRLRRGCARCGASRASRRGRASSAIAGSSSAPRPSPPGSAASSAASFSKYFLYSAHVVAAIVRSSPRASAGLSRLAASFWPACAAGADQRVRLVDEQDDRLRRGLAPRRSPT